MRYIVFMLLWLGAPSLVHADVIQSRPFEPCGDCEKKGWPVPVSAGKLLLGSGSPDGEYLAIIGGSGRPNQEYTVVLIRNACAPDSLHYAILSRHGLYRVPPERMPGDFVQVEWSPDSHYVFALGVIYRVRPGERASFTAQSIRTFDDPFIDFRFGPGRFAAGIVFLSAGVQQVRGDGQQDFAVRTDYRMIPLSSTRDSQIPKRENAAYFWVPPEMEGRPLLSWEEDGTLLLYTPLGEVVEAYRPPGKRHRELEKFPRERTPAAQGSWAGVCGSRWGLKRGKKFPRVRVRNGK